MKTNNLSSALKDIALFFEKWEIPYMVVGGIANSIHGEPRFTYDIDIKIKFISKENVNNLIENLRKYFIIKTENPEEFIDSTMVLPIESNNIKIDLIFATLPYEIAAIDNSGVSEFEGIKINVCTAEDLIIQKCISVRQKDWMDIEGIINKNRKTLKWEYVLNTAKELSEWISDNTIFERILNMKNGK